MTDATAPTARGDAHNPVTALDAWPDRDASGGDTAFSTALYRGIVRWTSWLVRGYYQVDVRGAEFAAGPPTLLVQNHTNGLVDAHMLMASTARPIRVLVKYKLMTTPFIGWVLRATGAVPMYRKKDGVDTRQNAKSFEAIDRALSEDRSVIALFPEGESLDAIGLRDLRTGVGRMAISAEGSKEGGIGLTVVATGVTYERRDRFRSRASVLIGEPIEVAEVLRRARAEGKGERGAVTILMADIAERMRGLILHAEDEEEYEAAVALERLLPDTGAPAGVARVAALRSLRTDTGEGAARRRELVTQLGGRLEAARLRGDDVLAAPPSAAAAWVPLLWLLPLLAVSAVALGPPFLLARQIAWLRRTPDKLVSLRCMFAFAGVLLWTPTLVAVGAVVQGWTGAASAAVLAGLALGTYAATLDAWLRARSARARRRLARNGEDAALGEAIRAIRAARGADPAARRK